MPSPAAITFPPADRQSKSSRPHGSCATTRSSFPRIGRPRKRRERNALLPSPTNNLHEEPSKGARKRLECTGVVVVPENWVLPTFELTARIEVEGIIGVRNINREHPRGGGIHSPHNQEKPSRVMIRRSSHQGAQNRSPTQDSPDLPGQSREARLQGINSARQTDVASTSRQRRTFKATNQPALNCRCDGIIIDARGLFNCNADGDRHTSPSGRELGRR